MKRSTTRELSGVGDETTNGSEFGKSDATANLTELVVVHVEFLQPLADQRGAGLLSGAVAMVRLPLMPSTADDLRSESPGKGVGSE